VLIRGCLLPNDCLSNSHLCQSSYFPPSVSCFLLFPFYFSLVRFFLMHLHSYALLMLLCTFSRSTVQPRNTRYASRDTASTIRAGIPAQNPKILKKFLHSITPYFTTTYLFSVTSVFSVANVFFVPNAQLRPFIETQFFCARGTGFQPVKTRPRWPCYFGL